MKSKSINLLSSATLALCGMVMLAPQGLAADKDTLVAADVKFIKHEAAAGMGLVIGGITGGLIGMGIPELEAKRYEGKLQEGNILISVHTENSEEITRAEDIFTHAGAQDICTTGEAATPERHKDQEQPTTIRNAPTRRESQAAARVAYPTESIVGAGA